MYENRRALLRLAQSRSGVSLHLFLPAMLVSSSGPPHVTKARETARASEVRLRPCAANTLTGFREQAQPSACGGPEGLTHCHCAHSAAGTTVTTPLHRQPLLPRRRFCDAEQALEGSRVHKYMPESPRSSALRHKIRAVNGAAEQSRCWLPLKVLARRVGGEE